MTNKKNIKYTEDPEFGLDSRYFSKKEQESESIALMEARLNRMKNVSKDQIIQAKLMQLKLKMEDYILRPNCDSRSYFTEFLASYIDTIYSKRSSFAQDINISSVYLSQVINSHREPKDEFLMKLLVHSEKAFENVCEFPKNMWHQIFFQDKICDIISTQDEWRPGIEKEVKLSEPIE